MKIKSFSLIAILLIVSPISTSAFLNVIADRFFNFLLNRVFTIGWNPVEDLLIPQPVNPHVGVQLQKILEKIDEISTDFKTAVKDVGIYVILEQKTTKILEVQGKIESKFKNTMEHIKVIDTLQRETIENLAEELSKGTESIENLVTDFHNKLFGMDFAYMNNVIDVIRKKKQHFTTNTTTSENVILYKFYLTKVAVEYKAMLMQKISCYLKQRLGKGNFSTEINLYEKRFKQRMEESLDRMRSAFLTSSRQLYKLDSNSFKKGRNYGEVTRFNQIYFTAETNLGHCYSICEAFKEPKHNFTEIHKYKQRTCTGTIHSCISEHTNDYHVWIAPQNSDKRYEYVAARYSYVDFRPGYMYGTSSHITSNSNIQDFRGWMYWFRHCDICRCMCDEPNDKKSIRSFSLSPLNSDIDKNMVITGVQIVLENQIFSLKIHQAPLLASGRIDNVASTTKTSELNPKNLYKLQYNKNAVYIGTAKVSFKKNPNFLVTGVKFAEKDGRLALEVSFTKFNYTTGELFDAKDPNNTITVVNKVTQNEILRQRYGNSPIYYNDHKPATGTKSGFIRFGPSSLKDDVGQSTVPFLDLQPVKSTVTALNGVGLMFRSRQKSGGFISPNILTYPMYVGKMKEELEKKA